MTAPIAKQGSFTSKVMLAFAARQECFASHAASRGDLSLATPCNGRITVHHFPPKGMGGATHRDDKIVPLCVHHHADAQSYRIPASVQRAWVAELQARFVDQATDAEWDAFCADRKRWRESRVFAEVES